MSKTAYPEWTPAWLAALPVEGPARNERDPKTPGLWFRKTAAGGMTWRWTRALRGGKTQTITLGTFAHPPYPGSMTINDARQAATILGVVAASGNRVRLTDRGRALLATAEGSREASPVPGCDARGASTEAFRIILPR